MATAETTARHDGVLVDTFLRLEAKVAAIPENPLHGELAKARKALIDRAAELEAEGVSLLEPIVLKGKIGRVEFGKRSLVRELVDKVGLVKLLGSTLAEQLAKFSLADIDRHTSEKDRETLLSSAFTGPRPLKSVRTA